MWDLHLFEGTRGQHRTYATARLLRLCMAQAASARAMAHLCMAHAASARAPPPPGAASSAPSPATRRCAVAAPIAGGPVAVRPAAMVASAPSAASAACSSADLGLGSGYCALGSGSAGAAAEAGRALQPGSGPGCTAGPAACEACEVQPHAADVGDPVSSGACSAWAGPHDDMLGPRGGASQASGASAMLASQFPASCTDTCGHARNALHKL